MPDNPDGEKIELYTWTNGILTRTYEFTGTMIASESSERPTSLRWTEFELYHLTDGTDRFVLAVIGRSVVYHVRDNECGPRQSESGKLVDAVELGEDAEPCPRCLPADLDMVQGMVRTELDRYSVHVCESPSDVVEQLRSPTTREISVTAMRLLEQALEVDGRFGEALRTVERL